MQKNEKRIPLKFGTAVVDKDVSPETVNALNNIVEATYKNKAMEIKEFTFEGFIKNDLSDDFRALKLIDGDKEVDLVKKFRAIFDLFESEVSVNYFLSDEKKSESEILEKWLGKLYGAITAEYETNSYHYSSYSYGTDYNTYLKIGGHDLFDKLGGNNVGKWCVLKINVKCA